jgi:drug/metabolite transporter (DMT)-like permease
MGQLRHLSYFISLGLFWGLSPSLYKLWANEAVPVSHVLVITGLGVGLLMGLLAALLGKREIFAKRIHVYGLICGLLINLPFALNIFLAGHVPPTDLAMVISTSPLVNYVLSLVFEQKNPDGRHLIAILLGLLSSAILIVTRQGPLGNNISGWLLIAFLVPFLYAGYNWYTHKYFPEGADIYVVGMAESFWSGILVVPFMLQISPPSFSAAVSWLVIGSFVLAIAMWVLERVAYFTLIREKGAVYTVQAVYVSTPAAVIFAALFFGGSQDIWLWVSMIILMAALYFNNSVPSAKLKSA